MRKLTLFCAALALCLTAAGATLAAAKHPARHHTQRTLTIYTVTASGTARHLQPRRQGRILRRPVHLQRRHDVGH